MIQHHEQLRKIASAEYPPLDVSGGDGIVYVGGGKYWPGIVVGCRMLRNVGCKLPIEVWYREGFEQVKPLDVDGLDITFRPIIDDVLKDRKYGGWAMKLEALYYTTFRRVLYLDADAYCVADPTELIRASHSGFKFWEDLPKQIRSVKWDQVFPDAPKDVPCVQGGQIFIDRSMTSKLINVTRFMCRNHNVYFRLMYGDQDAWRVALNFHFCKYETFGPARYDRVAFVCEVEGRPIIVHRVNGKLFHVNDIPLGRTGFNAFMLGLPMESEVFQIFQTIKDDRISDAAKVFRQIIDNKLWGGGCGGGSYGSDAIENVNAINDVIRKGKYRRIIDAGCGDMNIGKRLLAGQYVPVDVVPRPNLLVADITNVEQLPEGDFLVSKDTIHHWPNETVYKWINDLVESGKYKAFLIVADETTADVRDTILGGYRPLAFGKYPLNHPSLKRIGNVRQKGYFLWENESC